ncbi:hypothetical protein [Blastococcus saxobsidens]|uniref:Gluconate 2-dehydrogenase subunit 3 family protein n=1 Tax=Blastococcus saxobsidens (strain DD2) TaxID=1146883 RepID=H6RJN2_BLASD|nr:hypothetical protein [Blastococcus saxobsidens]CCG02337.1 conserved protein of unknown function [Blastococcus saxobsidens DD2]
MTVDNLQLDRPPLGGSQGVRFSPVQHNVLDALADALVPPGGGFPAPSEVDVAGFVARYTTPTGQLPRWYPYLAEDDLKARLDALSAQADDPVATLTALEQDDPAFFTALRDVVYLGYYSRPAVTRAINANVPAAHDYRNTPQPYGYLDGLEEWDAELLSRVRGSFLATTEVKPLDRLPNYEDASEN